MRTYSTHCHKDNLAWSILGEWLSEREAWPMVITQKKPCSFCSLLREWLYLNVRAQYQSASLCPPFILNSVTECITWGPPDTSTLHWWNETGAELHLQASARQCGISVEAARGQRNPGSSTAFAQADRQRTGPHCGGVKSCPVQAGIQLFMGAQQLSLNSSRSVTPQKDSLRYHHLQPHPKYHIKNINNISYCKGRQ